MFDLTRFPAEPRPSKLEDGAKILSREIRSSASYVRNQLRVRDAHPTYGVTKAVLRRDLARLEGLVVAFMILTGAVNSFQTNGRPVARYAEDAWGIDLDGLRDAVASA